VKEIKTNNTGRYACYFAMAGSFFFLLYFTRFKWGSLYVDTFIEFSLIPEKLLAGEKLYVDVFSKFGFMPPYLIALTYRLFGANLYAAAALGAATLAVMTVLLYRLARFFTGIYTSTLLVLAFLFVHAFGAYQPGYIFNFILPYNFNATVFMVFSMAALVFFIGSVESGKDRPAYMAGAALSMAFVSRPEMTLPVWGVFVLLGGILAYKEKRCAPLAATAGSILIAAAAYLSFLSWAGAFGGFRESVIDYLVMSMHGVSGKYQLKMTGFGDFGANAWLAAKSFAVQALAAAGVLSSRPLGLYNQYRLMPVVLVWMTGHYLYRVLNGARVRLSDSAAAPLHA
jgi:hypothetical protein